MLAATILAVFFVPVFFVVMQRLSEFLNRRRPATRTAPPAATDPEPLVETRPAVEPQFASTHSG